MKAHIKAISYYLPEITLSNEQLIEQFPDWSVEKVASKVGIHSRRVAGKHELSSDMAIEAANKLFAEHNIDRNTIDFIILCTQSPDYFLPTTACILQHKLGLPTTAGAFDFNLGCSGYVYGLAIAKGFVMAGIAKNILLLTSETYTKFIHKLDRGNRTIFGDAAAATLISTDGFAGIQDFVLGTDGDGANNLIVENGGLRKPEDDDSIQEQLNEGKFPGQYLYMNGPEIFNFTIESVPGLVNDILAKHNLSMDDVDVFVFHQANKYMLDYLRKKIKIPLEKFYVYLENCGNTVSSTIPIAIYEAMKEGKIKKGDKVLLAGFGVGYSWGATIIQF